MTTSPRHSAIHSEPSPTSQPLVCCILVNWNGWADTVECLRSLALQDDPNLRVIVVDNASTNDSVARIREACPEVEIIEAGANLGFSGGCNVGIRKALTLGADFVWLLNNDTIAPPDTLTHLLAATDPRVGITGTVLYFLHDPTTVQAWGGGRVLPWIGYVTHLTAPTDFGRNTFLTFASVLIRKQVFLEIGLMDERYFMYFDDLDYCFRARDAGWQLNVATDTAVLHKEGGSRKRKESPKMDRIATASGLRFLRLHARVPFISMALFVLSRFARRLVRGNLSGLWAVALGIADEWRDRSAPLPGGIEKGSR